MTGAGGGVAAVGGIADLGGQSVNVAESVVTDDADRGPPVSKRTRSTRRSPKRQRRFSATVLARNNISDIASPEIVYTINIATDRVGLTRRPAVLQLQLQQVSNRSGLWNCELIGTGVQLDVYTGQPAAAAWPVGETSCALDNGQVLDANIVV